MSFETPEYTANADALGPLRPLEAIRILGLEKRTRFYQASTSELYGYVRETPQRETSGETFVTRKITRAAAANELGLQDKLYLGNLDAVRDCARDYAEGMWMIVQQDEPDDYVLATGERHSVREFVEKAFACVDRAVEAWLGHR